MTAARTLKGRALQWLAQREHSRVELQRKLLPHAKAEDQSAAAGAEAGEAFSSGRVSWWAPCGFTTTGSTDSADFAVAASSARACTRLSVKRSSLR